MRWRSSGRATLRSRPRAPSLPIRRRSACHRLRDVELLAPIRPSTILCSGSNYRDHNAEKANTPISGKEPEFFVKTADCVVGPDEPIVFDARLSKKLDCEVELAIVIGKAGRHHPGRAARSITCSATPSSTTSPRATARCGARRKGMTWYELGSGKAFDSSAPLGPCIVTADEIGDPQKLKVQSRVNGELRQSSSTVEHDLDLRRADPLLLAQLHAQARHGRSSPARRPAPRGRPTRSLAARA